MGQRTSKSKGENSEDESADETYDNPDSQSWDAGFKFWKTYRLLDWEQGQMKQAKIRVPFDVLMMMVPYLLSPRPSSACARCRVRRFRRMLVSLRLSCRAVYQALATNRNGIWSIILDRAVGSKMRAVWESQAVPPHGPRSSINVGEPFQDTIKKVSKYDNETKYVEKVFARRKAIVLWVKRMCWEERHLLQLFLRPAVMMDIEVVSVPTKEKPKGGMIRARVYRTYQSNTATRILRGRIGKCCGYEPESDYLVHGAMFTVVGHKSTRREWGFSHGSASAWSDAWADLKGLKTNERCKCKYDEYCTPYFFWNCTDDGQNLTKLCFPAYESVLEDVETNVTLWVGWTQVYTPFIQDSYYDTRRNITKIPLINDYNYLLSLNCLEIDVPDKSLFVDGVARYDDTTFESA